MARFYELCKSIRGWNFKVYKSLAALFSDLLINQCCLYWYFHEILSKDSSAKYYQDNKERLQKRLVKDIKVFPKEGKEKKTIWAWTI